MASSDLAFTSRFLPRAREMIDSFESDAPTPVRIEDLKGGSVAWASFSFFSFWLSVTSVSTRFTPGVYVSFCKDDVTMILILLRSGSTV
jgi:hypothetical protein